jgi:putative transposase
MIAAFKQVTTVAINAERNTPWAKVWQWEFYEHVVRDDADFDRIVGYIVTNPGQWGTDEENQSR